MAQGLDWERDGQSWPLRQYSQFIEAGGLRWHVQHLPREAAVASAAPRSAPSPVALLIHGTGASTHSWRSLAPLLTNTFDVVSMDLPGHAFTGMPSGGPLSRALSLSGMAGALQQLLAKIQLVPTLLIGHSAGAAVAVRMALDGLVAPHMLVSLNGAFMPWGGMAGSLVTPAARLMATTTFVPWLFSRQARQPQVLLRLLDGTGSTLDAQGQALYATLVGNADHAAGALGMMAQWDLRGLSVQMQQLRMPLTLVAATGDRTVPASQAEKLHVSVPGATLVRLPGLGHLAHEERADLVARIIGEQYRALTQVSSS